MRKTDNVELRVTLPLWIWFIISTGLVIIFFLLTGHYLPWFAIIVLDVLAALTWLMFWALTIFGGGDYTPESDY